MIRDFFARVFAGLPTVRHNGGPATTTGCEPDAACCGQVSRDREVKQTPAKFYPDNSVTAGRPLNTKTPENAKCGEFIFDVCRVRLVICYGAGAASIVPRLHTIELIAIRTSR